MFVNNTLAHNANTRWWWWGGGFLKVKRLILLYMRVVIFTTHRGVYHLVGPPLPNHIPSLRPIEPQPIRPNLWDLSRRGLS